MVHQNNKSGSACKVIGKLISAAVKLASGIVPGMRKGSGLSLIAML